MNSLLTVVISVFYEIKEESQAEAHYLISFIGRPSLIHILIAYRHGMVEGLATSLLSHLKNRYAMIGFK